jgi:glycosyltransferase involved in cell wall biosynthesis
MLTPTTPSLDILLPFYGDVSLMKQTVESVRRQTDPEWRLIIVDDHQPDETVPEWVADLGDPRIAYHRNGQNLGANANYRRALELATADRVVVMGADDLMLPRYVQRMRESLIAHAAAAMFHPGVRVIDGDGHPVLPLEDRVKRWLRPRGSGGNTFEGPTLASRLLLGNWTYFPSICWRREDVLAADFDPRFQVVQDLALILELTARGGELVVDDEVTFEYRRHQVSDSALKTASAHRFLEEKNLFGHAEHRFRELGWTRAARSAKLHLTSRLNAVSKLPAAVAARRSDAASAMFAHVWSNPPRRAAEVLSGKSPDPR